MRRGERDHRDERGTITLWVLGLCLCVLFLGGLSLDLWRGIALRRELQSMADASAVAGADGLDEQSLRAGGAELDPERVRQLASETLEAQSGAVHVDAMTVDVVDDQVVVRMQGHVRTTLLSFVLGDRPFAVAVRATAEPRRLP
jgi:uncharacterized membrane protein